ncbi:Crp/Fnr family transcriptional regulator [Nonomuraea sp. ZG12]|uniref:Crp/Fnr family transcriptional regulator n=1 Tax=Nonomuraea sp. ZG12 TaxID=3452207 RepID=UPI003F8BAF89
MTRRSPVGAEQRRRWSPGSMMARLDDETQTRLLRLGECRYQDPGEVLISQGDPAADTVYLLQETRGGLCAKVTADLDNGVEALLGIMVSGDLIGEMAVLREVPRSATVTLCSRTLVHRIPSAAFLTLARSVPSLSSALAKTLADRLDWADRRRLDMIGYDVPVRVARVLLDLAGRHGRPVSEGTDVGVPLAQHELGRLVGAGEAAVSKAMRELKEEGLIRTSYRRVILIDPERLGAYGS